MTFSKQTLSLFFNTRPTILQVIPSLKSGGAEVEALEIGKAILKAGGKSIIASKFTTIPESLRSEGIELINLPLDTKNPIQIFKNVNLLKNLILKEKVDIVHARSRGPAWSAYHACRSAGIPFLTTYHAAYSSRTIFKRFYNSIMARGHRVIAISQFIQGHIVKEYSTYRWFDSTNLRLIERGINLNHFNSSTVSSEQVEKLMKKWKIPSHTRIILLPGRISKSKGQDLLIQALSLLNHNNVTVVFMGSSDGHEAYQDKLSQLATSLGLEEKIKWASASSDYALIATAYKAADIVVCPSFTPEGFGRVMAEAQAMRKPIIATNHGASSEVIEDGITGWLISPKSPNSLAQALDTALTLPQAKLNEMGKKGRERVKKLFSKDIMASKTIEVYQELLMLK